MTYQFDFGWLSDYWPNVAAGLRVTLFLIFVGAILGIAVGIACAWVRVQGPRFLKPFVWAYVEGIRNTPFLIQLYFVFFGLPALGVRLDELTAACLAMILNLGAYSTEIVRAGVQATPKGQVEAARSLAMSPLQAYRYVVLVPALRRIWPALSSQVVIVMLGSSAVSQIAAQDLTFAANFIQSRNFRAFETFLLITVIYFVLSFLIRQIMNGVGRVLFPRGAWR